MLNNGYQNLSLENIDISVGGTAAKLKDALSRILTNKIVILGDIVLSGEEKLPVGVECDISVSLSTEPDDWDPDVDGEFIPENVYSVTFKDVYGYDLTITDNEVVTSSHQSAVDTNIEDVAKDLIEGGTIDNAKPIYCHPITIVDNTASKDRRLTCLIFNNDPTSFDKAKFKDFLDSLGSVDGKIMLSGGFKSGTTIAIASYLRYNGTLYYLVGTDVSNGEAFSVFNADFDEIFPSTCTFEDGVNKIN